MKRDHGMVVHKRMSFFASLVWGISLIIVTAILSASGITVYGLYVLDNKMDKFTEFAEHFVSEVPDLIAALPPILGDAMSDRRAPEYLDELDVKISASEDPYHDEWMEPVVVVKNMGQETVSWLTLRVVVRDGADRILEEHLAHVATPLAIEDDCPGPLLPGFTRRRTVGSFRKASDFTAEYEVTDIRVWVPARDKTDQAKAQSTQSNLEFSQALAN